MTPADHPRPDPQEWTCEHGTTYTGSEEFISGARNAHLEFEARLSGEGRSVNDIAQEIVDACPQVEPLVEEWFGVITRRLNDGAIAADRERALVEALRQIADYAETGRAHKDDYTDASGALKRIALKARAVLLLFEECS